MGAEFKPTVFICFHPDNAVLVEDLIKSLQHDFHIATNEKQPSIGPPKNALSDEVGEAEFFIFILSDASIKSKDCKAAYDIANEHNRHRIKQIRFGLVEASQDYLIANLPPELTEIVPYELSTPGSSKYENMRKKLVNDLCREANVIQAVQAVRELEDYVVPAQKPKLKRQVEEIEQKATSLEDTISVGNITDSQAVIIGKNIRVIIEQYTLPPEKVERLTHLADRLAPPDEPPRKSPVWLVFAIIGVIVVIGLVWLLLGRDKTFSVYPNYDPSGYMGDIGDLIEVAKEPEMVRFTYEAEGREDHEWDLKYIQNAGESIPQLNPNPAQFAGVTYLNPPNNWGTVPDGGFDLRNFSQAITWEARSLTGEVNVEFVIGGVTWIWDEDARAKVEAPYPDSMDRTSLGIYSLTSDWQSFEVDLSNIPKEEFQYVVGGFAWVINWGSNGVKLNEEGTGSEELKTFIIEIRNIEYHGVEP